MQTVLEEAGEVGYYIDTWFIAVGVCTEFCLMVMQDFFLPEIPFFKVNLYIQGLHIFESKGVCAIFQKGQVRAKYLKICAKMYNS